MVVLIAASAVIGLGFLAVFVFAVRQGQFDDTWSPARRMLIDDDKVPAADTRTTPVERDAPAASTGRKQEREGRKRNV
jgi:cbb3-type cytochrome oxidase maturation protein